MHAEIEALFANQIQTWPRLTRGIDGLKHAQTRAVRVDWFDVYLRHIPHRVASTTAAVDAQSIASRPCFLCAGNLDPEERGVAFNGDYTIYCNPFPIVERHLTIVHRNHGVQRIEGEFGTMLDIAKTLSEYFVIYNGPECGASAPDHMHFQAGSRVLFPIEKDLRRGGGPPDAVPIRNYARRVFLFRESDRSRLVSTVYHAIDLLSQVTGKQPEPLINIAVFYDEKPNTWTVYLFPRGKHRPNVYHTGELTVSPASIDLCGIFVAPFEKDFVRITGKDVAEIFREVTLPENLFEEVAAKL